MPGVDGNGPNYISLHSAEVIISDIRQMHLKAEALRAFNVLLDEFLYSILSTSRSLATEKIRTSLLGILPTSLGKEALLEAEVELRAYWERTTPKGPLEDDSRTFHLQWSFELLRLKCEAYSTLNEEDEDPANQARVNEQFAKTHPSPPIVSLVDPAALYLTAIIESMCEHILSNVGRVAARDSSREYATVNDLFIALCEDDSIYGLFRMMKVYEQIELMSKTPKTRRSKSFSRHDRTSFSRTSSPQQEPTLVNTTPSRSRQSLEGQSVVVSNSGSRTSFDKARAIRMFNNKSSGDGDAQSGHRKSESMKSAISQHLEEELSPAEDAEMLREFDDLMRSASTMKVSLTPDRLKTMEVYKQEKDQRGIGRRSGTHISSISTPDALSTTRSNGQHPAIRRINQVEEGPKGRTRQSSVATPPTPPLVSGATTRSRSVSTSSAAHSNSERLPTRNTSAKAAPSAFLLDTPAVEMAPGRLPPTGPDSRGFPARTRTKGRNRDSMDLDDIMNGSDDDEQHSTSSPVRGNQSQKSPVTPRRTNPPHVSAKTRELIDFLAEGPPEPPMSKNGRDMADFLAEGPPTYGSSAISVDSSKPQKGAGRLQRMISKLNLGNPEKARTGPDAPRTPHASQYSTPVRPTVNTKPSVGTLSSLANRPIPPRPPRPISPPSSLPSRDSSDENKSMRSPQRKPFPEPTSREHVPIEKSSPIVPASPSAIPSREHHYHERPPRPTPPTFVHGNGTANGTAKVINSPKPKEIVAADVHPVVPVRTSSVSITRKPVPSVLIPSAPPVPPATPSVSESEFRDMQRLMSNASTADECRLILDMYMARNKFATQPRVPDAPYPSPSPSIAKHTPFIGGEASLETSLVELFLGTSTSPESPSSSQTEQSMDGLPAESDKHSYHNVPPVPIPAAPIQV